jgi:hypothetical protein
MYTQKTNVSNVNELIETIRTNHEMFDSYNVIMNILTNKLFEIYSNDYNYNNSIHALYDDVYECASQLRSYMYEIFEIMFD